MLAESAGDFKQIVESDIAFAAFDTANVSGMKTAFCREFFLRPPFCLAKFPNPLSQPLPTCFPHRGWIS